MTSLILAVVLGFAFDYDPKAADYLNVEKNPVLYHRVDLFNQWMNARQFTPDQMSNLKVVFTGRGVVRKNDQEDNDILKLEEGLTEAKVMSDYFMRQQAIDDDYPTFTVIEENYSTITLDNAIYTFWNLRKIIESEKQEELRNCELEKINIDLSLFSSDFHLVRSFFLFKKVYDIVKGDDEILKCINIPVLDDPFNDFDSFDKFTEKAICENRVFYNEEVGFKMNSDTQFLTKTIDSLYSTQKDQLNGFFGYYEKSRTDRWETLSKQHNIKSANVMLGSMKLGRKAFFATRGIIDGQEPGLFEFVKDVAEKFVESLENQKIVI